MKLKNWVVNLIVLIQVLLFIGLCCEADSTKVFIISKLIIIIPFTINHIILVKFSNLFKEEM